MNYTVKLWWCQTMVTSQHIAGWNQICCCSFCGEKGQRNTLGQTKSGSAMSFNIIVHAPKNVSFSWIQENTLYTDNFKEDFKILFIHLREGGKEADRKGNINVQEIHQPVASHMPTGDLNCNPSMCQLELEPVTSMVCWHSIHWAPPVRV